MYLMSHKCSQAAYVKVLFVMDTEEGGLDGEWGEEGGGQ